MVSNEKTPGRWYFFWSGYTFDYEILARNMGHRVRSSVCRLLQFNPYSPSALRRVEWHCLNLPKWNLSSGAPATGLILVFKYMKTWFTGGPFPRGLSWYNTCARSRSGTDNTRPSLWDGLNLLFSVYHTAGSPLEYNLEAAAAVILAIIPSVTPSLLSDLGFQSQFEIKTDNFIESAYNSFLTLVNL